MDFDFSPYFRKYEQILKIVDQVFGRMEKDYADCVQCKIGCADCCHALFDLTLIEALYLNHKFNAEFEGQAKQERLERANKVDRQINKIKRKAVGDLRAGKDENAILAELARVRVCCPLLNKENLCELYPYRPITCRFYGIPTAIGGKGHTCGLSGFVAGEHYPTVNLDKIHEKLQSISAELVQDLGTKYYKLVDMLVPLSMALITIFDEYYLGLKEPEKEKMIRPKLRRRRSR